MSNFANVMKSLRKEKHMTQAKLAEKLGLSKSAVSMYEQGRREPSFEIEESIADFFHVDINYLRGRSSKPFEYIGTAQELVSIYKELNNEDKARLIGYAQGLVRL